ncbi:MAG: GntR family transcriptional regulator [Clostridiales bacterium]|nr:GntR family transcriptional regulator [Clostridiales bacterium]
MSFLQFHPIAESKPIREIAYETLKHAIITGEIPAGERIVETEYAERLHISRTPLREALRKLERDGLVEYMVRRGVVVRAFTIEDVEQIYTIRNVLEMLTLPSIIENATPQDITDLRERLKEMDHYVEIDDVEKISPLARSFHNAITHISEKKRILRVIESQDSYITRFSAISIAKESRRVQAHQEHHQLVNYLEAKDLIGFTSLMQEHIEHSKENCLTALQERKELLPAKKE